MRVIRKIMIMAGGTGGHIFPGLVIARYLMNYGYQIKWLGAVNRLEGKLIPKHGIQIEYINIKGIVDKKIFDIITLPIYIARAIYQARLVMINWRPDIVLGMGGYVSGPGGIAAWSIGIPLVIHEQNVIAGFTNRCLQKIACKTLQAFPNALSSAKLVGNPIRDEILSLPDPIKRLCHRNGPIRILVIGGSHGAHIFNTVIPIVVFKLLGKITVWHQVGHLELEYVRKKYDFFINNYSLYRYKIAGFIDNIADAYSWADLVISRSGALTVSEVMSVGLAAIFVPFVHKNRHQYWNALFLKQIGAAEIIDQSQFTADHIINILSNLNRKILLDMSCKARTLFFCNSTQHIVQEIITI